jgi:Tfp pilus assembly protein PilO
MIKLKQTTITLLTILAILLVTAALLTWQLLGINDQVSALMDEVDLLQADNDRYFQLSSSYSNFSSINQNWLDFLPTNENEVALFAARVEDLARTHQLNIVLRFDDFPAPIATQGKTLYGINTDIILEGSYQGLIAFTSDLERIPYFYRLDKLILTQNDSGGGVDATLQGVLYMRQL